MKTKLAIAALTLLCLSGFAQSGCQYQVTVTDTGLAFNTDPLGNNTFLTNGVPFTIPFGTNSITWFRATNTPPGMTIRGSAQVWVMGSGPGFWLEVDHDFHAANENCCNGVTYTICRCAPSIKGGTNIRLLISESCWTNCGWGPPPPPQPTCTNSCP